MLIVGERINTSRKAIAPAVRERNTEFIQKVAKEQVAAGATFIDVNAGTLVDDEPEALKWLVQTVQSAIDVPLCIDSPNPIAIGAALKVHKGKAIINSITGEKERFQSIAPLVKEYGASVVALCMDDRGMPENIEERFNIAENIVEQLAQMGIPQRDIYIDPLVRPISTGSDNGLVAIETIRRVMQGFDGVHTICGLSNVSFGLPERKLLNQAFLIMCMTAGLDAVILDPLDNHLMALVAASRALLNKDEFCMDYIAAYKAGRLE